MKRSDCWRCFKEFRGRKSLLQGLNRPKIYCMICWVNISMLARRVCNTERRYQSPNQLRWDQRYWEKYCPGALKGKGERVLHRDRLPPGEKIMWTGMFRRWTTTSAVGYISEKRGRIMSFRRSLDPGWDHDGQCSFNF